MGTDDNQVIGGQDAELATTTTPEVKTTTDVEQENQDTDAQPTEEELKQKEEEQKAKAAADNQRKIDKRIAKLTWDKHEAERKVAEYEARLNPVNKLPDTPPRMDEFNSMQDYEQAINSYHEQKANERFASQQNQNSHQTYAQQRVSHFQHSEQEFAAKTPDYNEVTAQMLETTNGQLPPALQELILSSDDAAQTIYELGKNGNYADFLELSPIQQMMRLGALQDQVSKKTAQQKQVPKAPPPVTPTKGNATAKRDPSKMSDAEWFASRKNK